MSTALTTIVDKTALSQELNPQLVAAQEFLAEIKLLEVNNQDDLDAANEIVGEVKTKWKNLETRRTTITKPQNEALNATNALFQPTLKVLKECENVLKQKIATGMRRLVELQTAALKQIAAQSAAGDLFGARETMLATSEARKPDNISVREKLVYEILNLAEVPEMYLKLVLDSEAVETAIKMGTREIPGLRIYTQDVVTRRGT